MFSDITQISSARSRRASSWNRTGGNRDFVATEPGGRRVLAQCEGQGRITHIWMAVPHGLREVLLQVTVDGAPSPQINVPIGDFFCLGHGKMANFQSLYFTCSTNSPERYGGAALNCYLPMPFGKSIEIALANQSERELRTWYYVDYELAEPGSQDSAGILHAEFRRVNPFGGWGHELSFLAADDVPNKERDAWENNYLILETRGRGHYVGCNLSVTNLRGEWWGEGDDMIWVDGYKWPPDLHGTGSEDYFGHAWQMQPVAYLRNGSSLHERQTGGFQTSYVFHVENPIRFEREIRVTIEHGHANHLRNEMSSVAYWYAADPTAVVDPPPVTQRLPLRRDNEGRWLEDPDRQCPGAEIPLTEPMREALKGK